MLPTLISGLPYNFSTFTNCLGDLEGVGTPVSRIGWNIIFLMGNGNAKPKFDGHILRDIIWVISEN